MQTVVTQDGLIMHGLVSQIIPPIRGIVIHVHSAFSNFFEHVYYNVLAEKLSSKGIQIFYINTRGRDYYADFKKHFDNKIVNVRIGGSLERFEDSEMDIEPWVNITSKDNIPIFLQGHSLGAMKIIRYCKKRSCKKLSGLALLSPPDIDGFMESINGDKHLEYKEFSSEKVANAKHSDEVDISMPKDSYVVAPISIGTFNSMLNNPNNTSMFALNDINISNQAGLISIRDMPKLILYGDNGEVLSRSSEEQVALFKKLTMYNTEYEIVSDCNHNYQGAEDKISTSISNWYENII